MSGIGCLGRQGVSPQVLKQRVEGPHLMFVPEGILVQNGFGLVSSEVLSNSELL